MKKLLVLFAFIGWWFSASSQEALPQRELKAVRIQASPKLNGLLDDACWKEAEVSTGFTILEPLPGEPLREHTEVRFVYDNEAIYVGITNFQNPDSILQQLSGRDQSGNSDFCGVVFSCYRDGINGFQFTTTPAGEQSDMRIDALSGEDESWNAVWNCKTHKGPEGWTAEFRIPFAAIRFKNGEEQVWNINFIRHVRHKRHTAYWNSVNPLVAGTLTQMGKVVGISGVTPPKRIFLFPYASSYVNTISKVGASKPSHSYNVGMDLKLGLNDAFTLDATLVPDYGQVISDQLILNVTPFEVQFQDFRQFFTEGTELFNKAGLFYSRRIGGIPLGKYSVNSELAAGEYVVSNPNNTQLINATKISGRNAKGLGIGFFNAVTAEQHAVIGDSTGRRREVVTNPLSNYNMVVFDQNMKNNSYFSIVNTNVTRAGSWYDANVIGTQFDLRNKSGKFALRGSGAFNAKYGQRGISADDADNRGYKSDLSLAKIKGRYTSSIGISMMSDTYDPNDFGFNTFNNFISYIWKNNYNIYKPFGKFNNMWSTFNVAYNTLYKPHAFTGVVMDGNVGFTNRNWHAFNVQFSSNPFSGYNYFEPRVAGMKFKTNSNVMVGGWISSDYRRPVAFDIGTWYTDWSNPGRYQFNWRIAPRFRLNDHWFVTYVYSKQNHFNDLGFATKDSVGAPVFGRRDVVSHTNVLNIAYAITPWMTATCRVRHYWGYSNYYEFFGLRDDGTLGATAYDGFHGDDGEKLNQSLANRNFNSFTVDLIYRWIFTPGSEMSLVWKNAIIQEDNTVQSSLADDLDYTFRLPVNNNFSVKVLFFVDYRKLTERSRASSKLD